MKMTASEHKQNAEDFVGASQGLTANEQIDRDQLREQFEYTIADDDDIEAIASEIEQICRQRFN